MLDVDISVTSWSSYLYHLVVTGLRQNAVSVRNIHKLLKQVSIFQDL